MICKLCPKGKVLKKFGNTTSNLLRHVKKFHNAEFEKGPKKVGSKITDHFVSNARYARNSIKKKERDEALSKFIAEDMRPMNIIEGRGFRQLIKVMDPKYRLPTRRTITKVIRRQAAQSRVAVKQVLKDIEWIAFTADGWTSCSTTGFFAITSHFVTKEGYLRMALLSCDSIHQRETGENIRDRLKEIFESNDVRLKIVCGVTDGGSNIKKAIPLGGWVRIGCFAHALNLVANDAMKTCLAAIAQALKDARVLTREEEGMQNFDEIRKKIRKFVERLHRSSNAKDEFKKCQKLLGLPTNAIDQDVPTRWNSTYIMMMTFHELKQAVNLFLTTPEGEDFSFNAAEWRLIQQALEILEPLYLTTVEMSGEVYVSGSKVIPMTKILFLGYANLVNKYHNEDSGGFRHTFASSIHKGLIHHLKSVEESDPLALATLLDPRYKKVAFLKPELAGKAVRNLRSEMAQNMAAEPAEPDPGPSAPKQRKKALWEKKKDNPMWDILDQEITRSQASESNEVSIGAEVSKYLMMPNIERKSDPLKWWRKTGHYMYPHIWTVARKYLAIPATSVPSERVFSSAGTIISKKRASLSDDVAADLIMLRGNSSRLPKGSKEEML